MVCGTGGTLASAPRGVTHDAAAGRGTRAAASSAVAVAVAAAVAVTAAPHGASPCHHLGHDAWAAACASLAVFAMARQSSPPVRPQRWRVVRVGQGPPPPQCPAAVGATACHRAGSAAVGCGSDWAAVAVVGTGCWAGWRRPRPLERWGRDECDGMGHGALVVIVVRWSVGVAHAGRRRQRGRVVGRAARDHTASAPVCTQTGEPRHSPRHGSCCRFRPHGRSRRPSATAAAQDGPAGAAIDEASLPKCGGRRGQHGWNGPRATGDGPRRWRWRRRRRLWSSRCCVR